MADSLLTPVFVSFVTHGRNDNFRGNPRWRMEMCINSLALACQELGELDNIEILVTDWASDVPLSQVLRLIPAARKIMRFVYVPLEIAKPLQKDSGYPVTLAMNTTIRRASGEFVARMDLDAFFTTALVRRLFRILRQLEPGIPVNPRACLLTAAIRHIPCQIVDREPNLGTYLRIVERYERMIGYTGLHLPYLGGSSMDILPRPLWHEMRGYNESMLYRSQMEDDLNGRVSMKYGLVDLADYGVYFFHSEHSSLPPAAQNVYNPPVDPARIGINPAHWGLHEYDLNFSASSGPSSTVIGLQSGPNLPEIWILGTVLYGLVKYKLLKFFYLNRLGRVTHFFLTRPVAASRYSLTRLKSKVTQMRWLSIDR